MGEMSNIVEVYISSSTTTSTSTTPVSTTGKIMYSTNIKRMS